MERDERMLASLPGDGVIVWRLYQWNPWAISIGRHQDAARDLDLDRCRADRVAVVRRPTGGRAVYHAEELTYAVALPDSASLPAGIAGAYGVAAGILLEALRALGVDARASAGSMPQAGHQGACFASSTRHEIAVGGRKIVGSALRRARGGALQHGSILLGAAHARLGRYLRTPVGEEALLAKATDLSAVLGRFVAAEEVALAVRGTLAALWGPEDRDRGAR